MKTWFEDIPKYIPSEGMELKEVVQAEGVIEIQRRRMEDKDTLFSFEDYVGLFTRENGATNLSTIESALAHLNGCKVRVKIELLEFPTVNSKGKRTN